jgi:hypothetical protein
MKKILVSLLLIGAAAFQADAASKTKVKARHNRQPFYIDHSYDVAYSSRWADQAKSPDPDADFTIGNGNAYRQFMKGGTTYYGLRNFTVHGIMAVSMNAPYEGHDAPSWDGPVRNNYRNIRAYNESEPLPSNDGRITRR